MMIIEENQTPTTEQSCQTVAFASHCITFVSQDGPCRVYFRFTANTKEALNAQVVISSASSLSS